ncbi:MAG TPA: hypothetical protein VHG92_15100 [Afifellaceae bacterium]|nr:hypothetical protein [Afifellaceae bacterium]
MLQPLLGADGRLLAAAAPDTPQDDGGNDPAVVRTEPNSANGNSGLDWKTFGEMIGDYLIDSEELLTSLRSADSVGKDEGHLQRIGDLIFGDEWQNFETAGFDVPGLGAADQNGGTQDETPEDGAPLGTLSHWGGDAVGWIVPGSAGVPRLGPPPEDDGPLAGPPSSAAAIRLGQAPEDDDAPFAEPPSSAAAIRLLAAQELNGPATGSDSHQAAMQDSWEFAFDRNDGLFGPAPEMPDAQLRQGGETGFDMGSLPIRDDGFDAAEPFWNHLGGDWDLLV